MGILNQHIQDITYRYTVLLEPMQVIADRYGCTRVAVYYALKREGIDTSRSTNGAITARCEHCGKVIRVQRARFRRNKRSFCNSECYYQWLDRKSAKGMPYIDSRVGRKQARDIIGKVFSLQPGHIVHHEDRNSQNNEYANLKVFQCQGDHIRYHRGLRVPVVWDGAEYMRMKAAQAAQAAQEAHNADQQ